MRRDMRASRAKKSNSLGKLLLSILLACTASSAWAVDPGKKISQYGHTAWRLQDGYFTGAIFAITQTTDGYLWIGTQNGLWRFDGVRFVPWVPPAGKHLLSSAITALHGARDGSLWIGSYSGLTRWVNQELTSYPDPRGEVLAILERSNGEIWFTSLQALNASGSVCQVVSVKTRCYEKEDALRFADIKSFAEDASGNFWIGTTESLVRWKPGKSTVYAPRGLRGMVPGSPSKPRNWMATR
jgi:ligand-binding sensor domain-containing protein